MDTIEKYTDLQTNANLLLVDKEWNNISKIYMPNKINMYLSSIYPVINKNGFIISRIIRTPTKLAELDLDMNKFIQIVKLLMFVYRRKTGQRFQNKIRMIFDKSVFNLSRTNQNIQYVTITLLIEMINYSNKHYLSIASYIMFLLIHYCLLLTELPYSIMDNTKLKKTVSNKMKEISNDIKSGKTKLPTDLRLKLYEIIPKLCLVE
jgi:hypothetical protein